MASEPRSCGNCSLCCKLLKLHSFPKPANRWCQHCRPGKGGCSIYADRPPECVEFQCAWLYDDLPDRWRPDRIHAFFTGTHPQDAMGEGTRVWVDPGYPDAWRHGEVGGFISEMVNNRKETVLVLCGVKGWLLKPGVEPQELRFTEFL